MDKWNWISISKNTVDFFIAICNIWLMEIPLYFCICLLKNNVLLNFRFEVKP